MFLQRKFAQPHDPQPLAPMSSQVLPAVVREVAHNLDLLMGTQRGVGHVFPDFGFSQSGQWSSEGLITHCISELTETLSRYERRLVPLEIEGDLDDNGWPHVVIEGRVEGAHGLWRIIIDPARRCVRRIDSI